MTTHYFFGILFLIVNIARLYFYVNHICLFLKVKAIILLAFFLDTLKLRFLEILINKFAYFIVCYRRRIVLTFYIGFKLLKPYFSLQTLFFRHIWANLSIFDALKWRFLKIPMKNFAHFVVCYTRHLVPTFYISFRP